MGQLEFGIYDDDYENASIEQLDRYYGVHGNVIQRLPGQTGAGHPADEEDDLNDAGNSDLVDDPENWIDVDEAMEAVAKADHNVYTEPVSVPDNRNPFTSDNKMQQFANMLHEYQRQGYILSGMLQGEWEGGVYPTIQAIPSGQRGSKCLMIGLLDNVWCPRSELWVQALDIMIRLVQNRCRV